VCSAPFETMARTLLATAGAPDLRLLVVPHPLGGLAADGLRELAEDAAPTLRTFLETA
jgi:hypothetical protein